MPSERRLHPLSFLFALGGQIREFLLPGLVVLVGASSAGFAWEVWLMLLLVPNAIAALGRCLSYRYRFDESEMVIRSGFLFRNERHLPYHRIQNVDAVQSPLHRLFRVVEVRLQTGGGDEPEARMSVLALPALEEIRERVAADRRAPQVSGVEGLAREEPRSVLLALAPGELLLSGLLDNRGLIVVGAAFGILWELGLLDRLMGMMGEETSGRGVVRQLFRSLFGSGAAPLGRIVLMAGAFVVFLVAVRILSMAWAFVRLYGFTLTRNDGELRAEYGLLTRVSAIVPIRRIQTLTIREGPLDRLFARAAVQVETAGGEGGVRGTTARESLAPIIRRRELPAFLKELLPDLDVASIAWEPVHPRSFRRVLTVGGVFATVAAALAALPLGWGSLALFAALLAWAFVHARMTVRHLRWAVDGGIVAFRSGWIWRRTTIARLTKIQVVARLESPFDRRTGMASVKVDTPGAAGASHRVDIPYLGRDTARSLAEQLAASAASTTFRW